MLTGRYPQSNGLMGLIHNPWNWKLNKDEMHLSHILRDNGYDTNLFRFQHETMDLSALGFNQTHAMKNNENKILADEVAENVSEFLINYDPDDKPFYAQIGLFETHTPFDYGGVSPDYEKGVYVPPYLEDNDLSRRKLALLQASVKRVDMAVEKINNTLKNTGLDQNTIFIITTDHGIEFPRAKWFLYDPGIGIFLIVRWPQGGITGGHECNWLLGNVDFFPTILDLVGIDIPDNVQGKSFAPFFKTESDPIRTEVYSMFISNTNECRSVRTNRYKFIRFFNYHLEYKDFPVDMKHSEKTWRTPVTALYDLENDPWESRNLNEDPSCREVYLKLDKMLWKWMEEVKDPLLKGPVPTPYYERSIQDYYGVKE